MRLNREQQALVERNMPLAGHIAGRFRRNGARMEPDELRSLAFFGLIRAALAFDAARISTRTGRPVRFASFAGVVITRSISQAIDAAHRRPAMLSLDTTDIDGNPIFEPAARDDALANLIARDELTSMDLKPRPARIVKMRLAGMNMAAIGRQLGISRERVRQILSKAAAGNDLGTF